MKKFIYVIVAGALVLNACGKKDKKEQLAALKAEREQLTAQIVQLEKEVLSEGGVKGATKKVFVITQTLAATSFSHYVELQGKIDSDKNVKVSSKMAGVIQNVYVERGEFVSKGTLLAQIDASSIVTTINEVKHSLELANVMYEKQKSLWEQKVGTEVQYLQAKNQKEALEKRLLTLNEQYDMSRIRAPFEGIVDEIYVKIGEVMAPGMPAFRFVNNSDLKVVADVPESYMSVIHKGNPVVLEFPDIQKTMNSKVMISANVVDMVNRTFKVEIPLASNDKNLKANMIAYVNVKDYETSKALVIPVNVVQRTESGSFVYVVRENKAVMLSVKLGKTYKSNVEVLEGLKEGDQIITVGYQDVVDGQAVEIKSAL